MKDIPSMSPLKPPRHNKIKIFKKNAVRKIHGTENK